MESQMNKNMKTAKMKERMRAKFEQKTAAATTTPTSDVKPQLSEEELIKIFSSGEKAEKTPRGAKPPVSQGQSNKKKNGKK